LGALLLPQQDMVSGLDHLIQHAKTIVQWLATIWRSLAAGSVQELLALVALALHAVYLETQPAVRMGAYGDALIPMNATRLLLCKFMTIIPHVQVTHMIPGRHHPRAC
jgi:hypothetical protein